MKREDEVSPCDPSGSSALQEPAASRNGFAVLHFVTAVPVRLAASAPLRSALRDGPRWARPPERRVRI